MYWPDSSQRQPILDARVQRQIGERLRAMYNDVLAQGVSTRLAELLRQLDEREHEGHTRHDC
jgi:CRISPR/Cas system type I-B associated protein Csh2 (Cas7 group RAMP superfamily)